MVLNACGFLAMDIEPFLDLCFALAAGLLVGVQREQAVLADGGQEDRFFLGGIRTYPLYALAGAIATMLAAQVGLWLVGLVFAGLLAPVLIAYYDDVKKERDRGLTSEIAIVVTYLLGVLAVSSTFIPIARERYLIVAAASVILTSMLSLKQPLHAFAAKVSAEDIFATLKFLILAVIILPLLPNQNMGPLDVLNPFKIGLMIVLMAGLGFVGYVLIRVLGAGRGLALTGFIGGLVSSTVVTLTMAGRARREPLIAGVCALAVVLASTIMLVRVVILVAIVHAPLVRALAIPIAAASAVGILCAIYLYRRSGPSDATADDVKFKNPFELGLALKFGLLFAVILVISKAAQTYLGQGGVFLTSILAGTTDMDAITLSMCQMAKSGTAARTAAIAILLAGASNTIVKGAMAVSLGGWLFGRNIVFVFSAMILAGVIGTVVMLV
jgi:uncharacterized membrane protein (DUF4010 family)